MTIIVEKLEKCNKEEFVGIIGRLGGLWRTCGNHNENGRLSSQESGWKHTESEVKLPGIQVRRLVITAV
jgi:hypothetical protein